jgi:signal transduction histidine kinase
MLRTGARMPPAPDGEERRLAARETQVLDTLLAERADRARNARAALALLGAALVPALYLGLHAARARSGRARHAPAGARHLRLEREAAIAAQERQRIARDMHDGIGQDLYALKLELQRFHAQSRRTHPQLHAGLGQMLGLADEVMTNLRSVIDDLRPAGLEHGLAAAIHSQAGKFRRRAGKTCSIEVGIDVECDPAALNQDSATALFRILQEALANIRRHAGATHVRVQLAQRGGQLSLSVTDNGCGFDPAAAGKPGAFGLAGMRERVDALGGVLDIDSAPARGTTLTLTIPLLAAGQTLG